MRFFVIICLLFCFVPIQAQSDLPAIQTIVSEGVAEGDVYLATLRRNIPENDAQRHMLILDNDGSAIFAQAVDRVFNFGLNPDGLRYYYHFTDNGIGRGASTDGEYRVLDNSGEIAQTYQIVGDYPTQAHEIIFLENGHVVLLSQPLVTTDLTAFEGSSEGLVSEAVIQELDENGVVVFEWRSWEHLTFEETANLDELTNQPPDGVSYLHANSLTIDLDGHYILSARRFNELIKINRDTGDIIWRMGGQGSHNNEFFFLDDPYAGFLGQHHAQILPNGHLLLFDNGDSDNNHPARAVEYVIDEANRTATLVWSYDDSYGRDAPAMGSVQRLPNGNTLIGWGTASADGATASEVTVEGETVFELFLPSNLVTYRIYRFDDINFE